MKRKYYQAEKERHREEAQEVWDQLKDMELPYYPPTAAKRNLELLEKLIEEGQYG